jgi:hypothetical protein
MNDTVTDCLGRTREIEKRYTDGGYNCPFCNYGVFPVRSRGCENPACSAGTRCFDIAGNPLPECEKAFAILVSAQERTESIARHNREIQESIARTHELAADERRAALDVALTEAATRKACSTCVRYAHMTYRPIKFVKHRGACPRV